MQCKKGQHPLWSPLEEKISKERGNKGLCASSAVYAVFPMCSPLSSFSFFFFIRVLVQAVVLQTQFLLPEVESQFQVL